MSYSSWLRNKHVLVTGGASGIGLEFGRKCLANGAAKLAVLDLQDANDVVNGLKKEFPKAEVIYLQTDVSDKANVRRSFDTVKSQFGYIDLVLGSAGIMNENEPERTILVNLMGIVHSTYAAIDYMSTKNGGRGGLVVNISSIGGLHGGALAPAYCASKHGVLGLTQSFGNDAYFKYHGIKFITICPSYTTTPLLSKLITRKVEFIRSDKEQFLYQSCELLVEEIMKALQAEKNGSIWFIQNGKSEEVIIPNRFIKPSKL